MTKPDFPFVAPTWKAPELDDGRCDVIGKWVEKVQLESVLKLWENQIPSLVQVFSTFRLGKSQ